jgi:hypothetical protein
MELKPYGGALVGLAIMAIAIGGFCIYQAFDAHWHPWLVAAIADAIAVPIVALAWWTHRRRGLAIDNEGITEHTSFGETRIAWDDVSHYFYSSAVEEGWLQLGQLYAPGAIAMRFVPSAAECGRLAIVGSDGAIVRLYGQRWRESGVRAAPRSSSPSTSCTRGYASEPTMRPSSSRAPSCPTSRKRSRSPRSRAPRAAAGGSASIAPAGASPGPPCP